MTPRATIAAAAAVLTLVAGGCDRNGVEATEVLNYHQCQGLESGLTRVDYSAVAGIRGGTLLSRSSPPEVDGGADAPLLVAISRGRQPTPGYRFALEGAHRRDDTVVVTVRWKTPESGAVLAQMITHPCLVVALPANRFARVEAVDRTGTRLGTLTL